jgi:hypothetical protein
MAATKTAADRLKDAEEIIRRKNLEIADNNRTINRLQRDADTAEAIRQEIWNLAAHPADPPKWLTGHGIKSGERGCPITVWSDFHYGEVIDPDQVGGVNEFNKKIAKERFHTLVDTTIDLCENHMGRAGVPYPGIIVCLGGDMIGGDIHEELLATNDRTPHQSVNDLTDLLAAGLDTMASKFGRVFVPGVVGNHGRSTKKMVMKNRVFTNYDWSIYCNLERTFRKDSRIKFLIPNEADAHFTAFGHRFLLTHGDSLGVKGGDGIIGAAGPLLRGLMKLHRSKAQIGMDFDTAIICHYHQYWANPGLIVNGALKGYDEYAMLGLRAPYQRPTQALTFVHPHHGVTANWPVYLEKLANPSAGKEWVGWQR